MALRRTLHGATSRVPSTGKDHARKAADREIAVLSGDPASVRVTGMTGEPACVTWRCRAASSPPLVVGSAPSAPRRHQVKEDPMSVTIRSMAIILAVLVTTAAAWAAGERDITIAQGIDAEFLDVQMTNNIVTLIINGAIYDTLLTRDKQLAIQPRLATSYKLA